MELKRTEKETDFEYLLRLVLAKRNKEIHIDWNQIADLVGDCGSAEYVRKLSYGIYKYHDYLSGTQEDFVAERILVLSDLHIPFHLPVDTFEKYKDNVDVLVLNGDLIDMQSISRFPKLYRVSPMEEIIEGRNYIISLIDYLKPKTVIGVNGNHELRFGNYLAKNLDTDILELMPNSPIELIFKDGFTWYNKRERCKTNYVSLEEVFPSVKFIYPDDWKYQHGDTVFCHPLAFSSSPLKTGQKAYTWFLENGYNFDNLIVAHTHKVGHYMIAGKAIYESGCCADIVKNNYTDGKLVTTQSCGYVYLEQNNKGKTVNLKQEIIK